MEKKLIIVTGYFGSQAKETADALASELNIPVLDLDREVEKKDGRSIRRLVMMNGEHAYRNKEYEILKDLDEGCDSYVVLCGDGVLHDDDSREIIDRHQLVIAGGDMTEDQLWENARKDSGTYHAFMSFGTDEEKRLAFGRLIERQKVLFENV